MDQTFWPYLCSPKGEHDYKNCFVHQSLPPSVCLLIRLSVRMFISSVFSEHVRERSVTFVTKQTIRCECWLTRTKALAR